MSGGMGIVAYELGRIQEAIFAWIDFHTIIINIWRRATAPPNTTGRSFVSQLGIVAPPTTLWESADVFCHDNRSTVVLNSGVCENCRRESWRRWKMNMRGVDWVLGKGQGIMLWHQQRLEARFWSPMAFTTRNFERLRWLVKAHGRHVLILGL